MRYIPPFGSTDPDAPYVDRNTATAARGSAVPAAFFNDSQAELLEILSASGVTPDEAELQLAKAIQSQRMNFGQAAGTANAITVTLSPAPESYAEILGMPIRLRMAAAPTGAVTLNVNGLGAASVLARNGANVVAGEWATGDVVEFCHDGVQYQVMDASSVPGESLVHVGADTSPTANTIVATVSPAISAYVAGCVYSVKIANTLTAASTANLGGGIKAVTRADGSPTRKSDLVAGQTALLVYDGTSLQIANFSPANIPARNTRQFTASGSFTVPADVYRVKARVWGGGGGAGGSTGSNGAGSGGGGGGYAESIVEVTPGQIIPVTVGAAGAGGSSTPSAGVDGGNSSFGGLVSATGGGRGFPGNNALQTSQAGVAGAGTGSFNVSGSSAGIAFLVGAIPAGGIGGSSGMGSGSPTISIGGVGAPGLFPGGGGNGGSVGAFAGGAGAAGLVVIEY